MLRSSSHRVSPDARGSVTVIVALGMAGLVGLLSLAVDLAQFYVVKNELQNTADAAALAGAKQLLQAKPGNNSVVSICCSEAVTAAQNCASRNQSSGQPMTISDQLTQIAEFKKRGFIPGKNSYTRADGTVMVEITPGNFVNEQVAKGLGVKRKGMVDA